MLKGPTGSRQVETLELIVAAGSFDAVVAGALGAAGASLAVLLFAASRAVTGAGAGALIGIEGVIGMPGIAKGAAGGHAADRTAGVFAAGTGIAVLFRYGIAGCAVSGGAGRVAPFITAGDTVIAGLSVAAAMLGGAVAAPGPAAAFAGSAAAPVLGTDVDAAATAAEGSAAVAGVGAHHVACAVKDSGAVEALPRAGAVHAWGAAILVGGAVKGVSPTGAEDAVAGAVCGVGLAVPAQAALVTVPGAGVVDQLAGTLEAREVASITIASAGSVAADVVYAMAAGALAVFGAALARLQAAVDTAAVACAIQRSGAATVAGAGGLAGAAPVLALVIAGAVAMGIARVEGAAGGAGIVSVVPEGNPDNLLLPQHDVLSLVLAGIATGDDAVHGVHGKDGDLHGNLDGHLGQDVDDEEGARGEGVALHGNHLLQGRVVVPVMNWTTFPRLSPCILRCFCGPAKGRLRAASGVK